MKKTAILIAALILIPALTLGSVLFLLHRSDIPEDESAQVNFSETDKSGAEESSTEEPVSLYGCPHRADWFYFESDFDEHGNGTMLYRCYHCGSDLAKRALYRTPEGVVYYVDENGDYALCGINKEAKETVIPAAVNGRKVAGVDLISSGGSHVYLPATIEYITDKTLRGISLSHYLLDPANPYYTLTETYLIDKRSKTLLLASGDCAIPSDGSVTKIGEEALKNVKSVYIPASVTEISGMSYVSSFYEETTAFTVDPANETYVFKDGCLINKKTKTLVFVTNGYTLPADGSVTRIGEHAFFNKFYVNEFELFLPACIEYIGEGAFKNLEVTKLTIESLDAWYNVEFAGMDSTPLGAYERRTSSKIRAAYLTDGTEITAIEVPESVTRINDYAFCGWNSVSEIKFHNDVAYIGKHAFDGCWLRELTLPERVKELGEAAFASANLKTLHLPEGIVYIGEQCFANCRFDSVTADFENNGSIKLKDGCVIDFPGKTLLFTAQEFAIPDDRSVIRIAEKACYRTDAKSIIIPDSVEYIGANAFESCKAESVVIPDSVIYIGDNAFKSAGIKSVFIPASVEYVGIAAFSYCPYLEDVEYESGCAANVEASTFYYCSGLKKLTLPDRARYAGAGAFNGCPLETLVIPDSMVRVFAWIPWDTLRSISIGSGLKILNVGYSATYLESVYVSPESKYYKSTDGCIIEIATSTLVAAAFDSRIPEDGSVKNIGPYVYSAWNINKIHIPYPVEGIGASAFADCAELEEVSFAEGLVSIGDGAFSGCVSLKEAYFPNTLETLGEGAFWGCAALKRVDLKEGVKTVGERAFWGCASLEEITLPRSVESVGRQAFMNCTSLKRVYAYSGTVFAEDVFANIPEPPEIIYLDKE